HKIFTLDPSRKNTEHMSRITLLLNSLVNYHEKAFFEHY
ncbi:MAG: hypothetical protein ACI9RI_001140, partial [Oceanospirillaceae bacterium]